MIVGGRVLVATAAAALIAVAIAPHGGVDRARGADGAALQGPAPTTFGGPPGAVGLPGPWVLRSDKSVQGTRLGWSRGRFSGTNVPIPNAANAKRVTGAGLTAAFQGTVAWYRTTFTVPQEGAYALRFESVNHLATVWIDGRQVTRHTGEYLPFEAHTRLAPDVAHTLVVRADYRDPAKMKRTGWHRTWFNFGGINREVTIRRLGPSEISAPTLTTHLRGGGRARVDLSVHLANHGPATRSLTVSGALGRPGESHAVGFAPIAIPAGQTRVLHTSIDIEHPALWAPGSPNLYTLTLGVPNEAGYRLATGLREVRRAGTHLLLNGKRIVLRGASIHEDALGKGDALDTTDMDRIVAELKAIGANATRAQHPLSPALMERLDAAGIMVYMGVGPVDAPGAWTSNTPALRVQARRRVRRTLFQLQTHPSIIAWNLANEVAGNGHPGGQASYIDQMARELHGRDPGRLVALDVWGAHPPKLMGPMYRDIDVVGDTNYIGWYEDTLKPRAQVAAAIRAHEAMMRRLFNGKVLIVSEFGAEASSANATRKPGGYRFQADLLKLHIGIYRSTPSLSGMLVWNLRDFAVSPAFFGGSIRKQVPTIRLERGVNQKGLYAYGGKAKPAAAVVRAALAGR